MALFEVTRPAAPTNAGALFAFAMHAFSVRRQRAALKRLDADALRDIGLSEAEAQSEARRSLWDVPETWRV